jgi:hypothetical protein
VRLACLLVPASLTTRCALIALISCVGPVVNSGQAAIRNNPSPAEFASKRNVFERMAMLIGVEPQTWLTDVLERMVSGRTKANELAQLLPWSWKAQQLADAVNV